MAKDSLAKASTPEPFSKSKTSNWVARGGGLPAYIQHIAHDLMEKRGKSESNAIQMAIGIVKNWAAGKGNVDANTRAAARKAVKEWEELKAKNKAKKISEAVLDMSILETYVPPPYESPLELVLEDSEVGDLSLLEAKTDGVEKAYCVKCKKNVTPTKDGKCPNCGADLSKAKKIMEAPTSSAMSNTPRRAGESLGDWGKRLKAGDRRLAATKKSKTRSGKAGGDFNSKHPRGRAGQWTFKSGAAGTEVRSIQSRVGAKVDGKFGDKTKQAVMKYQRRHGLKVDGIVGAQTVAAMRGRKGKVAPGQMGSSDRAWLASTR